MFRSRLICCADRVFFSLKICSGTTFSTSAVEGSILALPSGALRTELKEINKFREFIAMNVDNWARYIRENDLRATELRLITGQLSASFWGIATFKGNRERNLKITFSQSAEKEKRYLWSAPQFVKTTLSGKIRFSRPSDTLAVTAYTITPRGASSAPATLGEDVQMAESSTNTTPPSVSQVFCSLGWFGS